MAASISSFTPIIGGVDDMVAVVVASGRGRGQIDLALLVAEVSR